MGTVRERDERMRSAVLVNMFKGLLDGVHHGKVKEGPYPSQKPLTWFNALQLPS